MTNLNLDWEKFLRYWTDYQGKYFYFETKPNSENIIIKITRQETSTKESSPSMESIMKPTLQNTFQVKKYILTTGEDSLILGVNTFDKIIGKIDKIPNFPPSLVLTDVIIKNMVWDYEGEEYTQKRDEENRENYGLILDNINYYEKIGTKEDMEKFVDSDRF